MLYLFAWMLSLQMSLSHTTWHWCSSVENRTESTDKWQWAAHPLATLVAKCHGSKTREQVTGHGSALADAACDILSSVKDQARAPAAGLPGTGYGTVAGTALSRLKDWGLPSHGSKSRHWLRDCPSRRFLCPSNAYKMAPRTVKDSVSSFPL